MSDVYHLSVVITWIGTRRTIEQMSELAEKYIGEVIKAIHEDIKTSQAKIEADICKRKK